MDRLRARLAAFLRARSTATESPVAVAAAVGTATVALAGAAAVWVVATNVFPYHSVNHDEGVYLQQALMLLEGQFFLRPPVEGAFRPWFFVAEGGRLYPKYAPVAAAIFALGELAGEPRFALVAVATASLALVAGVASEVFDRRTAPLAACFLLASPLFVVDSSVFLPYAPTTMLNLTFAYAYLRSDRTGDWRWAALAGAATGLAFFARPYTAVLFAAPFLCHALWTLRTEWRPVLRERRLTATTVRLATTATLGLAGVALALGYNAVVTGSPFLFPYQAFAPLDGLGFGQRRLLGHELVYTPEIAVRANRQAVSGFFAEWVAGGLLGTAVAALGVAAAAWRGLDTRQATVAGIAPSVVAGNLYFWGTYNILGDLDRAGDGLINSLGPYYHFDLLVPFAVFAAVGTLAVLDGVRSAIEATGEALAPRVDRRVPVDRTGVFDPVELAHVAHVTVAAVAILGLVTLGGTAVGDIDHRLDENREVTETYETAYDPFDGGPPANSLVYLPTPYGDWLAHPFQALLNDPDYDGRAVYALDERPFAVADAFPDRRLYRYAYRGVWAPAQGSPDGARLQRVRDVAGDGVTLETTVGIPDRTQSVTARVATDDGSLYRVPATVSDSASFAVTVHSDSVVWRPGDDGAGANRTDRLALGPDEDVLLEVFVDTGAGTGFSYRFDLLVDPTDERVRALTPRVERCRGARGCGGAAAYVPDLAPDGVFVRTNLTAAERNP